jgi:hypothetical protein
VVPACGLNRRSEKERIAIRFVHVLCGLRPSSNAMTLSKSIRAGRRRGLLDKIQNSEFDSPAAMIWPAIGVFWRFPGVCSSALFGFF